MEMLVWARGEAMFNVFGLGLLVVEIPFFVCFFEINCT